jgi:hypothetical protein
MTAWTPEELDRIGRATELQIASGRPDGSLRRYVTIWTVRAGDDVYVRSAHAYDNPWFQRALRAGAAMVGTVVSPEAVRSTLRVLPA